MSTTSFADIERMYGNIQRRFRVEQGCPELAEATQFYTNRSLPIHRWFHFKEGFAANLLDAAQINTDALHSEDAVFIDPFCGSGTTLLAGDLQYAWRARRIGVEVNPFLAFVTETKLHWRRYDGTRLNHLAEEILAHPLREDIREEKWPNLSTLHNADMISASRVSALLDVIERVRRITEPERDVLLLGIAAATERLSFYRKDGRALRVLRQPHELSQRKDLSVRTVLQDIWRMYGKDLWELAGKRKQKVGEGTVLRGDGRVLVLPDHLQVTSGQVTLMSYSPPYLNHIDYTEVYKVELWLLGFVTEQKEMLNLRKQTLRSHASTSFRASGTELPATVIDAVEVAAAKIEATGKKWHQRFRDTAFGYFEDVQLSLLRQYELLRRDGQAVCVVANSAHGSGEHRIPIAVDLLIAEIARNIGFEVEKLLVARQMRRRDHLNRFLRETAIVLRRPVAL